MTRSVVVTGAAAGIGKAVAETVLERWDDTLVALVDLDAAALADTVGRLGDRASAHPCDVADPEAIAAAVERGAGGATLAGLVNAAGIHTGVASLDLTREQLHEVLDVHIDGTFFAAQAAARVMVGAGTGGSIVNFGSVAMDFGWPGRLPYAVAKAAIGGITRTLAVEWAPHGIRVNAIAPGYVNTAMISRAVEAGIIDGEAKRAGHAMKRFAEPREVAEATEFLLSERASFITGEILRVDGGFTVTRSEH
jgi:NAD(P)-dependent dehydrogenase (short-subunit alcohol dehydrogenase family)